MRKTDQWLPYCAMIRSMYSWARAMNVKQTLQNIFDVEERTGITRRDKVGISQVPLRQSCRATQFFQSPVVSCRFQWLEISLASKVPRKLFQIRLTTIDICFALVLQY